jgi:cofilin
VSKFNELKLNKKIKYILYKLSDDNKEIVVEEASEDGEWDHFREKLINSKSKTKTVYSHFPAGPAPAVDT